MQGNTCKDTATHESNGVLIEVSFGLCLNTVSPLMDFSRCEAGLGSRGLKVYRNHLVRNSNQTSYKQCLVGANILTATI